MQRHDSTHACFQGILLSFGCFSAALLMTLTTPARAEVSSVSDTPELTPVVVLPSDETYEGLAFHDHDLFVGMSRVSSSDSHRVLIYDATGTTQVANIEVPHTVSHIYPYGEHSVIVVGKSAEPRWVTHFTVITRSGATFTKATTDIPEAFQVDEFAGQPGKLFFSEPGDAAVYRYSAFGMSALGGSISGPGPMAYDAEHGVIWAIERRSFEMGDENLLRIDPVAGNTAVRLFPNTALRNGLVDLTLLPDRQLLAVSESQANQVLLIDTEHSTVSHTVAVPAGPRGLAELGACLAVVSEEARTLTFIKLWEAEPSVLASWDLSSIGENLKQPRRLAVDATTGTFFVRSENCCPSCEVSRNSVYAVKDPAATLYRECMGH